MVSVVEKGRLPFIGLTDYERQELFASATIFDLPDLVENLSSSERKVFERIFTFKFSEAPLVYSSPEARLHVASRFKTEKLDTRQALKIKNMVWNEETLSNPLRANRPLQYSSSDRLEKLEQENPPENCDLCRVEGRTPDDPFGQVTGRHSVTRANAGAYTPWNSLVIPKEHHPLKINEDVFVDMIETANMWFQKAHEYDPQLCFPSIKMNTLPRAGASLFHPHLQVMIESGEPDQETEKLRKVMADYQYETGFPYLDDIAYSLRALNLVKDLGSAHIIFNPVPVKEKEVIVYSNDGKGLPNGDLSRAIYLVLDWWKKDLGVTSFNLVIYLPPLGIGLRESDLWYNYFPFARLVDRGPEDARTSDIGAMELYGSSVVASDPFKLSRAYEEFLRNSSNSSGSSDSNESNSPVLG